MSQNFSESSLLKSKLKTYTDKLPDTEQGLESLYAYVVRGNKKSFAEKLKKARTSKDISQVAMAKKLGVQTSTFSSWENAVNQPRISTIKQLTELYQIDAADLIDVNHFNLSNDSFVPLLNSSDFLFTDFENFCHNLESEHKEKVPVSLSEQLAFAYKVEDLAMFGGDKPVSVGSLILASTFELKDLQFNKKEILCKNKICIVSICHEEPMLRLIKYENCVLSLIALNGDYKSYCFPDSAEYEKFLKDSDNCIYHGQKTYSCSVEIFGIAKKMYVDL